MKTQKCDLTEEKSAESTLVSQDEKSKQQTSETGSQHVLAILCQEKMGIYHISQLEIKKIKTKQKIKEDIEKRFLIIFTLQHGKKYQHAD